MTITLFLVCLTVGFIGLLAWCSKSLPKERWQILATVPIAKGSNGEWTGLNITYYGFFNAAGCAAASAILFLLLGAAGVNSVTTIALAAGMLGISIPASRLVARLVENKRFTSTSNGALFVSLIALPWVIQILNRITVIQSGKPIPILPAVAGCAISYAYGESLGRMACISFGCCYGKRVAELPLRLQKIVKPFSFSFEGATKKVAYEGRMAGVPLVPVQALTSVVSFLIALIGTWLYLHDLFGSAFVMTIVSTQIWRFTSETLRADYRGEGKITAYQVMALAMVAYSCGLAAILPKQSGILSSLAMGFHTLWHPAVLLFLEILWVAVFIYYGRSQVTGSKVSFHVYEDRI